MAPLIRASPSLFGNQRQIVVPELHVDFSVVLVFSILISSTDACLWKNFIKQTVTAQKNVTNFILPY